MDGLPSFGDVRRETDDDESSLIARARDGHPAAFSMLVTRYLDDVTRFACYVTHSRDTADDVAQSVFIALWDRRATLDPSRPLKPYLFRAVRNRALNDRKAAAVRERYQTAMQADAEAGIVPAVVPSPEGFIVSLETVRSAMEQLAEPRRLALRLRLIDEMAHAEIAEVLGLTPVAARQLVHRAIVDLQKIMDIGRRLRPRRPSRHTPPRQASAPRLRSPTELA